MKYRIISCEDRCEEGLSVSYCDEKCKNFKCKVVDAVPDPGITKVIAESGSDDDYFLIGDHEKRSLMKEASMDGISLENYMERLGLRKIIDFIPEKMETGVFYEVMDGYVLACKDASGIISKFLP